MSISCRSHVDFTSITIPLQQLWIYNLLKTLQLFGGARRDRTADLNTASLSPEIINLLIFKGLLQKTLYKTPSS